MRGGCTGGRKGYFVDVYDVQKHPNTANYYVVNVLEASWVRLGGVLGRLVSVLEASWDVLGSSWGVLGAS